MNSGKTFFAFCISTYKRPGLLKQQVELLLQQTFKHFEIVISDNDPERTCGAMLASLNDERIRYFNNGSNLGMIPSFNASIERASAEFVTLVTDDDPVSIDFLETMYSLIQENPGFGVYAGFERKALQPGVSEVIKAEDFISEILDPHATPWMLWSSCTIRRKIVAGLNRIPDYGSPHLADHAFLAIAGSIDGAVVMIIRFSSLSSHNTNYSKFNFSAYYSGCVGFYRTMDEFISKHPVSASARNIVLKHLHQWVIVCFFNLKTYYTKMKNYEVLREVESSAAQILELDFMKRARMRYKIKNLIFGLKKQFNLLS